ASRRIAGKLASLDRAALRAAVVAAAPALEPERARAPEARPRREASGALAVPAPAARSVVAVAELPAAPGPAEQAVLVEVRSALRGRTPEEIAAAVPGGAEALRVLEARGHVVMRGHRYFPA
ncbi:MAG TPA: PBS lyase, partial [Anaeromyxobacteraceae bacterium]|nr:PBS lyase [Anaeromyxobacteraceae bacterium]